MENSVIIDAEKRLDVVAKILPELGKMLLKMQREDLGVKEKVNHMDLVTRGDLASEKELMQAIDESFPGDAIQAEESGARGDTKVGFCWVLDPVDGTLNYAHGLPLFGISVGLMYDNVPVAGLVLLPAFGTLYRAVHSRGASCDGQKIQVSSQADFSRSLLTTGFPYNRREIMPQLLAGVDMILTKGQGMRRTGAATVDLCWMAAGKFEGGYELNLSPWDTCACQVIITEAGGKLSTLDGGEYHPEHKSIVFSNGLIHDTLLANLEPLKSAQSK